MYETQARALITAFFDGYDNDRGEEFWEEIGIPIADLDVGEDGLFLALGVAAEFYSMMEVLGQVWDKSPTDMWVGIAFASQAHDDAL